MEQAPLPRGSPQLPQGPAEGAALDDPFAAVANTDEPTIYGVNDPYYYFGYWEQGRIFAYAAWNSFPNVTQYVEMIGDPFITK